MRNLIRFFYSKYFVSGLRKQRTCVHKDKLCVVFCSYFGFDFDLST